VRARATGNATNNQPTARRLGNRSGAPGQCVGRSVRGEPVGALGEAGLRAVRAAEQVLLRLPAASPRAARAKARVSFSVGLCLAIPPPQVPRRGRRCTPASCAGHAPRQACERLSAGWRVPAEPTMLRLNSHFLGLYLSFSGGGALLGPLAVTSYGKASGRARLRARWETCQGQRAPRLPILSVLLRQRRACR
jgi:hypothetical protein